MRTPWIGARTPAIVGIATLLIAAGSAAGQSLGRRIAHFVFTHALRKCNKGNKCE